MMTPLCYIKTPFYQKFGVPRQSLLVDEAWGILSFPKNDFFSEAFRGIDSFSHLWLIFEFHQVPEGSAQALVRPPRFENKKKLGVFATRSPHRPNRIGMSVVKFENLKEERDEVILTVSGLDLVNGTPILDIKPYIPYADCLSDAYAQDFSVAPSIQRVNWSCQAPPEKNLIEKVIALDPRPGQDRQSQDEYAMSLAGWNVRFRWSEEGFVVFDCEKIG
jgi:tRNA (adenine37-N6)-methyltransferase